MNYFAYGSNMDVQQMAVRCPDAVVVGTACLQGHRFLINTHGVATVVPSRGKTVHGVLWEISKADEASLDRYEGVASGFYCKATMRVRQKSGRITTALIYIAKDEQPGTPRAGYMERVAAAAKSHRLSAEYD
ncbi:MAG: gamma-glutamylcyclotransferase family protein [Limisphaerales bacterium]